MGKARSAPDWSWAALLALGSAGTLVCAVPRAPIGGPGLFLSVLGLALCASLAGWRGAPADEQRAWLFASLTLCAILAGNVVWWRFPTVGLGPFHAAADVVFLLACVPLAIAAALLGSARAGEQGRLAWIDAGILTAVSGVVAWDVFVERYAVAPNLGITTAVAAVAHPLLNVVVIGLVLRLVLSHHGHDRSTMFFATGAILILLANLVFHGLAATGSFSPGSPVGALWLAGYLLLGFAALQPSELRAVQSTGWTGMGRVRLGVVLMAVFVPQVVLARDLGRRGLLGINTVTIAAVVSTFVMALAAVRLLRSLEARLSTLIFHSTDAIFLVDEDSRIAFATPSADELWGRRATALVGASVVDSFVEEHREAVARQLANLLAMPRGATVPIEGRIAAPGGQIRVLEGVARNLLEDESVRAIVVTLRDTTKRHELEQQLERRAFQDGLTGLANRTLFVDRLEHALDRSARNHHAGIAVLFIDVDDFKSVNDGMGHSAGDEVIRGVAERIRSCVRVSDTVARLGGDEFTVLVEDTPSVVHVAALADRLLEVLQLPMEIGGVSLTVPASIGVAIATDESTAESLLRDADIAMYSAKSQGKSRVTLFDATLREGAVQRLALKVELPEALRSDQFSLAFQPIVDVHGRELCGFEALIRWHHPQRGLVSPGEFIPVAEETGLIVDIGRWALDAACQQAVAWNRTWADPLSINVNVSALQLHQPAFIDDLRRILASTGLDASLLTLELTESVLAKQQRVESILRELRTVGVGIAIDDFGTGYSSLSYLQQFPVTSIKVDQSFVAGLSTESEAGLVRSILSIGHAFGLTTVAEGVETSEQLELLEHLGCHHAQGFFVGRPQRAGEIDGLLEMKRMARSRLRTARNASAA